MNQMRVSNKLLIISFASVFFILAIASVFSDEPVPIDTQAPTISAFSVSENNPLRGKAVRIYYKASDNLSAKLQASLRIEKKGKLVAKKSLGEMDRDVKISKRVRAPRLAGAYAFKLILIDNSNNQASSELKILVKDSWRLKNIKRTVSDLSRKIGVRQAGSYSEHRASRYIARRLKNLGYKVKWQKFKITGGKTSSNIIAQKKGSKKNKYIIGAHYDTKYPSPGANDNASGTAVVLEMARLYKYINSKNTIVFAFFGSEEIVGSNPNNHHFGSRYFVKRMSTKSRRQTSGMINVDMVGYGGGFHVRSMRKGPMRLVNRMLRFAKKKGYRLSFLKDPGRSGWSDHEAFELAGIPVAWLEWRNDPVYHSAGDNYNHMQWSRVNSTIRFLYRFLGN